ncbi:otoraplin [Labeo rohita]|uniref:Otoraplin n=1 Tax=Labeo rohita TaxID=84645 RepID=A0A498MZ06_LABRO|nr:otoraplin [Labeo rohita]RXN27299.1 otoraplin [Labeo rohita]
MDKSHGPIFLLICVGFMCHVAHTALMEKLADFKICADKDCSSDLSANLEITAAALLLQVYGERYVDQMGVIGYFPRNYVNETHVFQKKTVEMPTTDMDFFCA